MKKLFVVAGMAVLAACAESADPVGFEREHTLDVPGNVVGTPGCTDIDLASCFAILDNQVKVLYERAAWAARFGEADYQVITGSNKELSYIFQAETRSVTEAVRALDKFKTDMERAVASEQLSHCWGDHLIAFTGWLRDKVAAGDVDVSDAPVMTCRVSPPAAVAVSGSTQTGVVLTVDDPWHYSGDPYGVYTTETYFVVEGPSGTITTAPSAQSGAASVVISDPATNVAGTYSYSVAQCSSWGYCSEPFVFDVDVVDGPAVPACVHDNRDKDAPGRSPLPKCGKARSS